MGKNHTSDIEFERNRQEVLKMAQKVSLNKIIEGKSRKDDADIAGGDRKAIWEYEIIEHRKKKNRERFMMFGGICGIISLLISIALLLNQIFGFIK